MIHTIGDSHSMFGWKDIAECDIKINHIGPKLMYTFGKDHDRVASPKIYQGLGHDDIIIHSFGEIDCRCHVSKYVSKNRSYIDVIDDIANPYVEAILHMKKCYMSSSAIAAVYSIVPPIRKTDGIDNTDYPFLGSDEERLLYHKYMNTKLRSLCDSNGIMFFDVTKKYEDHMGYLRPEKSDRICHVSDPAGIVETLYEMKLLAEPAQFMESK